MDAGSKRVFQRSGPAAATSSSSKSDEQQKVCDDWRVGKCNRFRCPYLHREFPPPPHGFAGDDQYGGGMRQNPNFNNSRGTQQQQGYGNRAAGGKSEKVCSYWLRGNCRHGDKCWFLHSSFTGDSSSVLSQPEGHQKPVHSRSVDYTHFISLPLATHPKLVDKLVKFQKTILGNCDMDQDEIPDNDSGADSSDKEHGVRHLGRAAEVAVKLNVQNKSERVNVDITPMPLVSYPAKTSKASSSELKSSKLSELGIERSIFINPKTFHLTVLVLSLWNKDRVEAAAKVLRTVSSKVMHALDGRPVSIRLKGLECMKGSFAEARVLYAPVEEIGSEGRLLRACQVIIDAFVEAGLVLERDAQRKLKLHATVMNVRHRERKFRTQWTDCFDARSIVDRYGSEEWGEYLIREAHLSQMFVFDENGYYHCCASIPFLKICK